MGIAVDMFAETIGKPLNNLESVGLDLSVKQRSRVGSSGTSHVTSDTCWGESKYLNVNIQIDKYSVTLVKMLRT